jgi:hypothetical protein
MSSRCPITNCLDIDPIQLELYFCGEVGRWWWGGGELRCNWGYRAEERCFWIFYSSCIDASGVCQLFFLNHWEFRWLLIFTDAQWELRRNHGQGRGNAVNLVSGFFSRSTIWLWNWWCTLLSLYVKMIIDIHVIIEFVLPVSHNIRW